MNTSQEEEEQYKEVYAAHTARSRHRMLNRRAAAGVARYGPRRDRQMHYAYRIIYSQHYTR